MFLIMRFHTFTYIHINTCTQTHTETSVFIVIVCSNNVYADGDDDDDNDDDDYDDNECPTKDGNGNILMVLVAAAHNFLQNLNGINFCFQTFLIEMTHIYTDTLIYTHTKAMACEEQKSKLKETFTHINLHEYV